MEHLARLIEDQPRNDICDRCGQPIHLAAPDSDPDAASWYHNEIADDVFCGVVGPA